MKKKDESNSMESITDLCRPIRLDTIEDSLFVNMYLSLQTIKSYIDRIFQANGISGPQFNVLRSLQARNGKATVKEINQDLLSEVPGVTRLIDRLIQAGYVSRKRGTEDRRTVFVTLTEKGEHFIDNLAQNYFREMKTRLSHMDRTEIEQMILLMAKTRQFEPQ